MKLFHACIVHTKERTNELCTCVFFFSFFFLQNNKLMIFDISISMHGMVQCVLNRCLYSFPTSPNAQCISNRHFICILSHLKCNFFLLYCVFLLLPATRSETNAVSKIFCWTAPVQATVCVFMHFSMHDWQKNSHGILKHIPFRMRKTDKVVERMPCSLHLIMGNRDHPLGKSAPLLWLKKTKIVAHKFIWMLHLCVWVRPGWAFCENVERRF